MSIQRHEEKSAPAHRRERERARFGSSIYMFISTWACSMQIGSARSVVCFTRGPHSGPWTFFCSIFAGFSLSCLLATAILDSFSLFYLPNRDQDHPHGKEMQKSKMAVWGGLTNSCEKKRSEKQRRKRKI